MNDVLSSVSSLSVRISATEQDDEQTFRPRLFDASLAEDRAALADLRASGAVRAVHDRIDAQTEELVRCLNPAEPPAGHALADAVDAVRGGRAGAHYGTWAWYPWSGRLVHVLPRREFRLVRTDRNRDKITREQQTSLLGRRIGVIGLSVGNSAALTCAMEGLAGSFRLADFDRLGLSNLNRLRCGVHELGVPKTVLCARQLSELDPYLDVEVFSEGITPGTIDAFFAGAGLDLLVEECDTLWVKLAAREHARARGVPVLMDMNDRGMLDVERFDLEPGRPVCHGRAGALSADDVAALPPADQLALLLRIVDQERLTPAMTDALGRIGRTLSSWPQLASGTVLGGALVADTARRILLGEPVPSGRYYADLEALVPAAAAQPAGAVR
ncbi:ThiF family adenylyltransferase [Streptomyces sp. NPDC051940]|uniref:ThiF family adenylyltransferase n=1 Tax=Streptomyces sp. NPDC051940 TaxID=3155675 RepID=UPI00341265BA